MATPPLSRPPAPPSLRQWLLALGVAGAALYLLRYHIYYLNHLDARDWGWRYLMVNRENTEFLTSLRRMKLVICVLWAAALGLGFYYSRRRLMRMGWRLSEDTLIRTAGALFVFLCTVVNYDPPDIDLSVYFFVNSLGFAAFAYALYSMPYSALPLTLLGKLALVLRRVPTWLLCLLAANTVLLVSWQLGEVFFSRLPMTVDTSAQLAHAKVMLLGGWTMPSHPLRDFFNQYMVINNGQWYSQYPPGHVMMLALGTFLKARIFVNPVLGALTTLAIFGLALELWGLRVARIAVVLSGLCVYLIMISSEYMSNATSLLMGTLFLWAYFRLLKQPCWQTALWGGAALGYCFITRPYSAVALALPFIIHACYMLLAYPRRFARPLLVMAGVGGSFVMFQLYYNYATNGHPFTFGYELTWGEWHNPLTPEAAEKLSESELVKNFRENSQRSGWFNRMIFEWPVPCLFLVALVYAWRGNRTNEKLLFLTLASAIASCQVLPGNVEREWGPRLMYEILGVLVALCARGLSLLPAFFRIFCLQRRSLAYYYGFAAVMAFLFYDNAAMHNLRTGTLANIYNFNGRGNNPGFYKYIMRNTDKPALVFVSWDDYQAVAFTNPPLPDNPVIFASNLGKRNNDLIRYYPDRTPYHAYISGGKFRIDRLRGPAPNP